MQLPTCFGVLPCTPAGAALRSPGSPQVVVAFYVAAGTDKAVVKWCNDQGYSGIVQVGRTVWLWVGGARCGDHALRGYRKGPGLQQQHRAGGATRCCMRFRGASDGIYALRGYRKGPGLQQHRAGGAHGAAAGSGREVWEPCATGLQKGARPTAASCRWGARCG